MLYFKELQFLQNLAKAHDFVFVDANETFPEISPAHPSEYYYSLHFNNAGHDLIAKALLEGMTKSGIVPVEHTDTSQH
jgi:lysophospholipase L1-like esterase